MGDKKGKQTIHRNGMANKQERGTRNRVRSRPEQLFKGHDELEKLPGETIWKCSSTLLQFLKGSRLQK